MSVVVAIKDKGKVYVGADSQVTRGGSRLSLSNPNNYKIWKVANTQHSIMGAVGLLRDACAVKTMDNLIREIDDIHDCIDFEYVMNRVMPMIVDELKERDFLNKENPYKDLDSRFLLASRDKLFTLECGAVIEHDDLVAMGSGESEAIGSLLSTKGKDPVERIVKAIKASAAHDIYVDYPIILIDTETMQFDVINETNEKLFLEERRRTNEKRS